MKNPINLLQIKWANSSPQHAVALLYCLTLLAFGIGNFCFMTPFEGLDEPAHYASIRQIAFTGSIPIYGTSFLEQYSDICTISQIHLKADRDSFQRQCNEASASENKTTAKNNYEAQHPPLYYLLLAPVVYATQFLSVSSQLFILRIISFGLALGGVFLGILAICGEDKKFFAKAFLGFLIYPIVFPMFWGTFARIGNDSLCLLFTGLLVFILSRVRIGKNNCKLMAFAGCVLGLGLLTKGLFLPIVFGCCVFFAIGLLNGKNYQPTFQKLNNWKEFFWMFTPAVVIGGWWYVYKLIVYGDIVGAYDAIQLASQGGLLSSLWHHPPASGEIGNMFIYLIYNGIGCSHPFDFGKSFSNINSLDIEGFVFTAAFIVVGWGYHKFIKKGRVLSQLPCGLLFILVPFLMGLVIDALRILQHDGAMGVRIFGGWYIHILLPWIAPRLGVGLTEALGAPRKILLFSGFLLMMSLKDKIMEIQYDVMMPLGRECSRVVVAIGEDCVSYYDAFIHFYSIVLPFPFAGIACYIVGLVGVYLTLKIWQSNFSRL